MRVLIAFLFGLRCILGDEVKRVSITDYMPEDNVNTTDQLGICYGSTTQWSAYPYAAALRYTSGAACCSASIVSLNPPILLSAAHCDLCTGAARIGCNNPNNCDGGSYPLAQFTQHPNYQQGTQFSNDIALVQLTNPITYVGAGPVTIPSQGTTGGNQRAVGYGITETGSIPTTLQTAILNVIGNTECQAIMAAALGPGTWIDSSMICIRGGSAGQDNVPAICSGDSGGPWTGTTNRIQAGVTSWGLQGCSGSCNCCTGFPGVGANVAQFYSWINGYLQDWDLAYERDQNLTRARRLKKSME
jgi:secreted trypsin-like serine protease